MVQLVFPEDVNPQGTLYGGRMMHWIATAVTLTASRCARGPVAPGVMDDFDFFHPVFLGEIGGGPAAGALARDGERVASFRFDDETVLRPARLGQAM